MSIGNLILIASFVWAPFFGFWNLIILLAIFILIIRPVVEVVIRKIYRKLYGKYDKALTEILGIPSEFIASGYPEYPPKDELEEYIKKQSSDK